jgi:putative acyl-CoA dehydrogenase
MPPMPGHETHEVLNQPPPLSGYNLFTSDRALGEALDREGAGWARTRAVRLGARAGDPEVQHWGFQANENPPRLRTHDRYGHRIDEVEYHPAYHQLLGLAIENELHALPWRESGGGGHVARAALESLVYQVEAGVFCPVSMTYAAIPALRHQPELAREWEPRLTTARYDPRSLPADQKMGATSGMAMTEKQGGSDVRANTTVARPLGAAGAGREYELVGHKWFCSAPMSDVFLVLAQAKAGPGCFLMPRWRPDGTRNRFLLQRLKDKLGNRANASSEIELDAAWARLVGEEGRGVQTIIEMVQHTRLDCVIGSASLMRQAVAQATHHAAHRTAFGKPLEDHALMRNVLADLCLESEAATATMMRLARAFDEGGRDPAERALSRLLAPLAKYWICKRTPVHVAEALECMGGNGFIEESIMPRLYREAPLNSLWEGAGNVICLDILRALGREPECLEAFWAEVARAQGGMASVDAEAAALRAEIGDGASLDGRAIWPSVWPSCSRLRCSSGTRRRSSPRRSAGPASSAAPVWRSAPCPRPPTSAPSSSEPAPISPERLDGSDELLVRSVQGFCGA